MRRMIDIFLSAMLILGGSAWSMDDWTQKFPANNPGAWAQHGLCYIGNDQVLLYGGASSGYVVNGETWLYSIGTNTWINSNPTSNPGPRYDHVMAYVGSDRAVLFGGTTSNGSNKETWLFDASENQWTNQNPTFPPLARTLSSMAYIGSGKALLFGGETALGLSDSTWLYDAATNTWTNIAVPGDKPSARKWFDMAYIGNNQVLLFGGNTTDGESDETWVFNLGSSTWTKKNPANSPSARFGHKMAYIGADKVLLFGGGNNETWIYDSNANSWVQDENETIPLKRQDHGLAETSMDGSRFLVMYGGWDYTSRYFDTWTFGGGDFSLPVELASFAAEAGDSQVKLIWTTQSEIDCAGFNIYRAAEPDGERQRLNPRLIPGAGTSTQPHDYDYTDYQANNGQTYFYYLENQDYSGLTALYGPIEATPMAAPSGGIPTAFALQANFPNPFNPGTWLAYDLPSECEVELAVFTLLGARVRTLMQEVQKGDSHLLYWNGMDDRGANLPSGIYLVQLKTPAFSQTRKVTLVR